MKICNFHALSAKHTLKKLLGILRQKVWWLKKTITGWNLEATETARGTWDVFFVGGRDADSVVFRLPQRMLRCIWSLLVRRMWAASSFPESLQTSV